jgi:hypothetical protein
MQVTKQILRSFILLRSGTMLGTVERRCTHSTTAAAAGAKQQQQHQATATKKTTTIRRRTRTRIRITTTMLTRPIFFGLNYHKT